MGIDQDQYLQYQKLKDYIYTKSDNCKVEHFDLVQRFGTDEQYYPLSPNLMSRFDLGYDAIKLINYMDKDRELNLYVRGTTSGKQHGYKPVRIFYKTNKAPRVSGDIQNKIEVREDEQKPDGTRIREF